MRRGNLRRDGAPGAVQCINQFSGRERVDASELVVRAEPLAVLTVLTLAAVALPFVVFKVKRAVLCAELCQNSATWVLHCIDEVLFHGGIRCEWPRWSPSLSSEAELGIDLHQVRVNQKGPAFVGVRSGCLAQHIAASQSD